MGLALSLKLLELGILRRLVGSGTGSGLARGLLDGLLVVETMVNARIMIGNSLSSINGMQSCCWEWEWITVMLLDDRGRCG